VKPYWFLCLALLLPACSLPTSDQPTKTRYRLNVPELPVSASPYPAHLAVDMGYVAPELAGAEIVVQEPGNRLDHVAAAGWPAPLPAYLQQQIIRAFAASDLVAHVSDAPVAGSASYQLMLELLDFRVVRTEGEPPRVRVRIHALLQRLDRIEANQERVFRAEAEVPAAAERMSAIMPAFDQAFAQVVGELAAGVRTALDESSK